MNDKFFESNEYYLVDTFNGETKKSKLYFSVINNTKYKLKNSKEIAIESTNKEIDEITGEEKYIKHVYEAFIKSSVDTYKDDLDVINSEIAELLDISSSKVYKVETSDNLKGVVSIGVKEKEEQQINLDVLVNKLIKMIKDKGIALTSWLKDYFSLPNTDPNLLLNSEKDIVSVIEMTINTISILFRLNSEEQEKLRKDYLKMIFFDLISNNTNRSFNTYSILVSYDIRFSRLSPIYDYNNDIDSKSYYLLNNQYIDKSAILSVLYHKYYVYIKRLSKGLTDNLGLYLESINLIIDNNVDSLYSNSIKDNYKNNIDLIKNLESIHSKNYFENKLDIAMTQTSINLNALNKNQMIHSKYRQRNKSEEIKVESSDAVKIKIEPKKEESKLFSRVMIVLFGIILISAIIIGIIFIIKKFA
ncbi:MAG: hypothetical protein IJ572_03865 [Bacilli bacterium]|nr:hypothetical protein [Bacilli bacterium]